MIASILLTLSAAAYDVTWSAPKVRFGSCWPACWERWRRLAWARNYLCWRRIHFRKYEVPRPEL